MRYLIYLRVSTDEQDLKTQLDHCLRFIRQRDTSQFQYEIFSDKISSRKELFEREGGKALLATVRQGDIIIAMRLDRISRKLHETTELVHVLEKKKADILLVEQPGISNKAMLGIYAGMAEEEVKLIRKRITEKMSSKRNRNERCSRFLPYGFRMHETKTVPIRVGKEIVMKRGILVPLECEQRVIERMKGLSAVGMSYSQIAKELTNQGYKNREGKAFQKMSIYRILQRVGETLPDQPLEAIESLASH